MSSETMERANSGQGPTTGNANSTRGGGSQNSILSSKVFRALEVRSDTPAMKAALDALAHLPDHQDDLFTVDSRSVRVAIEQDALQQALLLQDELRSLLQTVTKLRQGVSETAAIAHRVDEVIHSSVITTTGSGSSAIGRNNNGDKSGGDGAISPSDDIGLGISTGDRNSDDDGDDALEQEQRLALLLSDCFTRRNIARKRVETVHEFLERFDLSEEDSRLLEHYAFEDVETSNVNGVAFLNALERVQVIRKELGQTVGSMDVLQSIQKHSHRLSDSSISSDENRLGASSALRMMETLAQKQERAYERLYHWLQKYLHLHSHEQQNPVLAQHDGDRLDEILSHPFVRRSLQTLKNVPAFYSHLLELIAQSRRSEETRRFLLALTSGHNGLPPIEMRAHDSVVYVGDMLAFCFRAFSVEADVVRGLFSLGGKAGEEGTKITRDEEEKDDDTPSTEDDTDYMVEKPLTVTEMLALSMGGISRPLKSRILQVISNLARRPGDDDDGESDDGMDDFDEEGASIRSHLSQLYEICGLLLFYASAVDKSMAKLSSGVENATKAREALVEAGENPIVAVILDCLGEATNAYEASLRVYASMLEQLQLLTGDSEASLAHTMIVRIVDGRKESPGFAADVDCPEAYRQILSLDWSCNVLVEAALPACKTLDDTVTLKRSISVARQGNLAASVVTSLEQKLSDKEGALIDVLVEKETADVLDLCGLGGLVSAWDRFKGVQVEGMTMATFPGLTPDEAESGMKEFFSSLYSPPIPSFENTIKDPTLRKLARNKIAKCICESYAGMHDAMLKPDTGGYGDTSFLGHSPQQVNTLFTV
uniref:Conserved Oligomeric Golgi complex subunit 6 C-terminal domain-containing protein n=1 Tax=Pseudo-nitzschia australis TaxID=44445 RepID=A0A7S4EQN4_9STRA